MPLLLRLSETISATRGLTVSIFALDYSLAPEHPFPCQLSQAATAYTYLTTELNIPPSNIVLTGDSAGGSIALSLLTHLRQPNPGVEMVLPREEKPKALFLLSPWVSLASEKGYKEKEASDILHPASLAGCVRYLLPTPAAVADAAPYLEFATPTPSRSCNFNELLPEHVWVSAGEDEIFLHNITSFVDEARKSGVKVEYEIESGKFHDWQLFDSVQNAGVFLGKERGARDEGEMEGVERIGRAVAGVFD
ncbi:alpha/beta-hydrolase [Eremomyces bilateralis CBS 781.70]|uniref:Alpha/beta-hydrolase n=1 Tax=Eremomyces bilateralis CBS 781.70 TaxID=1392243 RepID=A0A6G1G4K1_9PEZI|nr:alpha/beta-hydrolase [Eremomyces bilateralis CBS 781.70]KAF1812759.1 alpha/beta-hydrolase [Eremomyces bilateralis CBS 781.70]